MLRQHFIAVVVCVLGLTAPGCSSNREPRGGRNDVSASSEVFVPGPEYRLQVTISLPKSAKVGEWVPLKATRESGPWVKAQRAEVAAHEVALRKPPPAMEEDVQSNFSWHTEPEGAAVASVPKSRADARKRSLKFTRAGEYRVWAETKYPTPGKSNVVSIRIEE